MISLPIWLFVVLAICGLIVAIFLVILVIALISYKIDDTRAEKNEIQWRKNH